MAVIDHITTNNSATYEIQDTVARTKANNLESADYTDIGGGFADGNTFLVKTNDGMKKGYLNNFVNWILDKLATKVYNQLATSNKTMIGALNELNNLLKTQIIDTRSTNKPPQYYYSNYPQTVVYELKKSISVDDPFQVAAFLVLQTITPWCDITAGSVIQRAYMSGKVKIRYSKSTDSWSEWTD